jgi:hypothetical protein
MKSRDKIFCIGYNKSGSSSLAYSIQELGFSLMDLSAGERLLPSYTKSNLYSTDIFSKELLSFSESADLFKDVPFSLPNVWRIIYDGYPDAKFILSVRDSSEQWFKSITNFHASFATLTSWKSVNEVKYCYTKTNSTNSFLYDYMISINGKSKEPYNKATLIASYNKHNDEVVSFFKNKPNFIMINVAKDDDYIRLCKFLGKESKLTKFLHIQSFTTKPKPGAETKPPHLRDNQL